MVLLTNSTVILLGDFVLFIGFMVLFTPNKARAMLREVSSTNFISYAKITVRLILSVALILHVDYTQFSKVLEVLS